MSDTSISHLLVLGHLPFDHSLIFESVHAYNIKFKAVAEQTFT